MNRAFIYWHYLHAEERMVEEHERREDFVDTLVALLRPDVWKKIHESDGRELFDNASYVEHVDSQGRVSSTLDSDDFKRLISQRENVLKNSNITVISRQEDGGTIQAPTNFMDPDDNPIIVESK